MGIHGSGLYGQNFRLRLLILIFMGIAALSSVVYWRTKTLETAEYVELTTPKKRAQILKDELSSPNYKLEVIDTSPTVK